MSEQGLRRASLLLMALGEDDAVEVFKYLGPKEVQKLGFEMANIGHVGHEEIEEALPNFEILVGPNEAYMLNDFVKSIAS